jgi:DNA-binding transcriptional regulator YiaG
MNKTSLKKEYSARIKAWKGLNPRTRTGVRSSTDTKAEAVRIAALGKAIGETQTQVSKRLGVCKKTLHNWSRQGQGHPAATIVAIPVPVAPAKPALDFTVDIVLPGGARVVELTAEDAIEFMKALA